MQNSKPKKVALIIMDGWGYREDPRNNAIKEAKTPFFDKIWSEQPHTLLEASGLAVGLPEGQMGNSEIGHTTIGAGSAIDTDLVTIEKAIRTGAFFTNEAFTKLVDHINTHGSKIHMLGLLGDGGVHSHNSHIYAFLELAKQKGLAKDQIVLHLFTDGRDTAPGSAKKYFEELETKMREIGVGVIGSFGGRYFGMDRAGNQDRIDKVMDVLFSCQGNVCHSTEYTPAEFMHMQYEKHDPTGKIDEYLEHQLYTHENGKNYFIEKNDGVFFFNFRADRARQLTQDILKHKEKMNLYFVSMTQYGEEIDTVVAFAPADIKTTLAKELSKAHITQAHVSESEKFPHVTFFLNGQSDLVQEGEKHVKIDSRTDIATHDLAPEMKAKEIVDASIEELKTADFLVVNFPNADVVGHTGNIPAIIEAVEAVDRECQRLVDHIVSIGGAVLVTADHGNAEVTIDESTGAKHTAHTTNPVPCILVGAGTDTRLRSGGTLADLAPTIIDLFGLPKADSMKGFTLIEK